MLRKLYGSMLLSSLLAMLSLATQAYATPVNLLTNGSFETGSTSGWTGPTTTGNGWPLVQSASSSPNNGHFSPEDGTYFVYETLGSATLSQAFTDAAGATMQISGWYSVARIVNNGGSDYTCCSSFSMSINGTSLISASSTTTQGWRQYTDTFIATGHDIFAVTVNAGTINTTDLKPAIDNFSVTEVSPPPPSQSSGSSGVGVPEPAGTTLLALAFAALALLGRRARRLA